MTTYSSQTHHRKLLSFPNYNKNTTVQTCLYFCQTLDRNDTVATQPKRFCPTACLAICPSICHYSLSSVLPPNNSPTQPNSPHNLSPLLITMLIVLASVFLLITFYFLYTKLYFHFYHNTGNYFHNQTRYNNRRRNDSHSLDEEHGRTSTMIFHPIWYISTVGLNPTVINSIPINKYQKRGDDDSKDCTVCLAEFEQGNELKILPKCNHAFHVTCIDTWLRSHVTCPLCRAPIATSPSDPDHTVEDSTTTSTMVATTADGGGEEGIEDNLEGCCLEDKKEIVEENSCNNNVKGISSSQRWSLERKAVNLVSRSLSCSGKIFSSRFDNKPSSNS